MGFPRQEYWSRVAIPSPGDIPDPGIESGFPALQADSSEPSGIFIYTENKIETNLVWELKGNQHL